MGEVLRIQDADELAVLLREAEAAHAKYEAKLGKRDEEWADWYADFIAERVHETQEEA
jgi:hypothetical protein